MKFALFRHVIHCIVVIPYTRFGASYRSHLEGSTNPRKKRLSFWISWTLKTWPIGRTKMWTRNYHYTLRNIPEEHWSQIQLFVVGSGLLLRGLLISSVQFRVHSNVIFIFTVNLDGSWDWTRQTLGSRRLLTSCLSSQLLTVWQRQNAELSCQTQCNTDRRCLIAASAVSIDHVNDCFCNSKPCVLAEKDS